MSCDQAGKVTDQDLSDYLDGSLEPLRRAQVDAAIRADPKLARTLAAYHAQEEDLREMAGSLLNDPVPEHLLRVVRNARRPAWRPPVRQLMQLAASLLVGVAIGWLLQTSLQAREDNLLEPFLKQAVLSHELFEADEHFDTLAESESPLREVRSPFQTPIRIPQLLGVDYRPVLFRSVEGRIGPGVELAYADAGGSLTSLLIRQHSARDDVPVRFREAGGRSVLYWLDGPLLYVLVGTTGEDELRQMARSVYAATASGGGWQPQAAPLPRAATTNP